MSKEQPISASCAQTCAGMYPAGWTLSTVGSEFEVELGKMLDGVKNAGTPKPYIGNRAVQWNRIDTSELGSIRISTSELVRYRLEIGDLLVCEGGEVGRAAIWDAPISECYYQKALHRLRTRHGYDPRLMQALLQLWATHGDLANEVTQTSIAHLPREKLVALPLPVPPTKEQRAIADALGDVDALLDALDRQIAKQRDLKQAAMQELLTGRTRLPGFAGEWRTMSLGDALSVCHGRNQREVESADGPYPILASGGQIGTALQAIYNEPSVLIRRKGTIDEPQYMATPFWTVDTLFYTRMKNDNSAKFFYYRFWLIPWSRYNEASGVPSLNAHTIEGIEISVPEAAEQTAIAAVLFDMDAEIAALEARRLKTRDLKQAMLQELLTGRTRLV